MANPITIQLFIFITLLVVLFAIIIYERTNAKELTVPESSVRHDITTFRKLRISISGIYIQQEFYFFQIAYVIVYGTALFADWLQGPYLYELYVAYGLSKSQIGFLYAVGFTSSCILGTIIGLLADIIGRKKVCLLYCCFYGTSCILQHFNVFKYLLLARICGGVSTSILFSAFDGWMLTTHNQKFGGTAIDPIYEAVSFGNGCVAIVAGVLSSIIYRPSGVLAPFKASLGVLAVLSVLIIVLWNENYGTTSQPQDIEETEAIVEGTQTHKTNHTRNPINYLLLCALGLYQSFFESCMYVFVLIWTPTLPAFVDKGVTFAIFMQCLMIGSKMKMICNNLFKLRLSNIKLTIAIPIMSAIAFEIASVLHENKLWYLRVCIYGFYEMCVGMYFSVFYSVRGTLLPENNKTTILNLFRVPLNIFVIVVCLNYRRVVQTHMLHVCAFLSISSFASSMFLNKMAS